MMHKHSITVYKPIQPILEGIKQDVMTTNDPVESHDQVVSLM